jgi:hypothetical protein
MRESIVDPRFDTFNPEEKCKQCGHSKREHFNVFCKREACDCLWHYQKVSPFQSRKRSATTKMTRKKEWNPARVTTKTYTRFQPHPKKYKTNAERQAAYRKRHEKR